MQRQRGAIIRRGENYSIKYRTPTGKQKWESGFGTGHYAEPKQATFASFAEEWIGSRVSIRGSTLAAYQSIIKLWLTPAFGHRVVSEIQLSDVQRLVMDLSDKVSAKTLKNCLTLLRVMLVGKKGASGVKRGFIRHDPTRGVELPSRHMKPIVPLSVDQVWKLIDAAATRGELGHAMVYMDAFTGLRRNEILALEFTDIDWFSKEVSVTKVAMGNRVAEISKIGSQSSASRNRWTVACRVAAGARAVSEIHLLEYRRGLPRPRLF